MKVKKKMIATGVGVGAAVGITAVMLKDNEKREKIGRLGREWYTKLTRQTASENAAARKKKLGFSDPEDMEDNRMVSEGAMTSIRYYNRTKQNE